MDEEQTEKVAKLRAETELLKLQADKERQEIQHLEREEAAAVALSQHLSRRYWFIPGSTKIFQSLGAGLVFAGAFFFLFQPVMEAVRAVTEKGSKLATLDSKIQERDNRILAQRNEDAEARNEKEKDQLINEREALTKQKQVLERVVDGLNVAVERAADGKGKFFSIWNSGDPINELSMSHGWDMSSNDHAYYELGMYQEISHKQVRSDKMIRVGRIIEINELKRKAPDDWQERLKRIGPVLAVDYSYFGLLVDKTAPVGGTLYKQSGESVTFYAPLSEWTQRLGDLLQEE